MTTVTVTPIVSTVPVTAPRDTSTVTCDAAAGPLWRSLSRSARDTASVTHRDSDCVTVTSVETVKRDTVTARRDTASRPSRCHGHGCHGVTPQVSGLSRPRDTTARHHRLIAFRRDVRASRVTPRKDACMTPLSAVEVTGQDPVTVLDKLRDWVAARPNGVTLMSVTFAESSSGDAVTALAVYTESEKKAVVVTAVQVRATEPRPEWLTDKLLAGNAKDAMYAYLDHNPDTPWPALAKWAQQYFPISDDYGRTAKRRWLNLRNGKAER